MLWSAEPGATLVFGRLLAGRLAEMRVLRPTCRCDTSSTCAAASRPAMLVVGAVAQSLASHAAMTAAQAPPMNKRRPNPPPQREGSPRPRAAGRLPLVRIVISLLDRLALRGRFSGAAVGAADARSWCMDIAQRPPMQWYLDALYLNQGHSFLRSRSGPGPPDSLRVCSIKAAIDQAGRVSQPKEQWPRLRYHRHFMLADQAGLPATTSNPRRTGSGKYLEAYARHLLRVNRRRKRCACAGSRIGRLPRVCAAVRERRRSLRRPEAE